MDEEADLSVVEGAVLDEEVDPKLTSMGVGCGLVRSRPARAYGWYKGLSGRGRCAGSGGEGSLMKGVAYRGTIRGRGARRRDKNVAQGMAQGVEKFGWGKDMIFRDFCLQAPAQVEMDKE